MFDQPQPKAADKNSWLLVWMFMQKPPPDSRKKARCVVNGSKRWHHTIKLGQTYAKSFATDSERLFWALAAKHWYIVVGADVSNAFAKAPAPGDTFYIFPDAIFHDWWTTHKKRPPIPTGWVFKVKYALQGHPEAPPLWKKHIGKYSHQNYNTKLHITNSACTITQSKGVEPCCSIKLTILRWPYL